MTGAATPRVAYPGNRPMNTVASPMIHRVAIRTPLRPRRSPMVEKMTLPMGRAAKATP